MHIACRVFIQNVRLSCVYFKMKNISAYSIDVWGEMAETCPHMPARKGKKEVHIYFTQAHVVLLKPLIYEYSGTTNYDSASAFIVDILFFQ